MKKIIKLTYNVFIFTFIILNFAVFNNVINFANAVAAEENLTTARGMAVMEVSTGRLLYTKNENEQLPMASTTKIITAIVAIENNNDLSKIIEIEKDMTGIEGTSIYLKAGEHLSIEELLYGLMLRSGNDAAVSIAKATSGSVNAFVDLMNEFCKRIGANNTQITNPHGLPDDNHYTTARDLATISCYAMKNEKFANLVGTRQKTISNELNSVKKRILNNKNKLLKNMDNSTGIKTGFTKKAGRCFVGSAEKDGMEVVCVLLNCAPMFEECQSLLEKAFSEYKLVEVIKNDEIVGETKIIGGEKESVKVTTKTGAVVPLKVSEVDSVQTIFDFVKEINAPHDSSDAIGKFDIYASNNLIFSGKLYIIETANIRPKSFGEDIIKDFLHVG